MSKSEKNARRKNYSISGKPMTQIEFKTFIEEAERSKFISVTNLKEQVLIAWQKKYRK